MALNSQVPESLIVATADKQLHRYSTASGQLKNVVRTTDTHLPITMDAMTAHILRADEKWSSVLIGYSATDRSIRVQDVESGATLAKGYGHSESISAVCILDKAHLNDSTTTIITSSLDGSVRIGPAPHCVLQKL